MRDVASKTEEGSGVVLSEEADPVLSLSAQVSRPVCHFLHPPS